eukprot:2271348-Rhodomonas_salina.1
MGGSIACVSRNVTLRKCAWNLSSAGGSAFERNVWKGIPRRRQRRKCLIGRHWRGKEGKAEGRSTGRKKKE